ncbi:hypothetical protein SeLEV6574_g08001 [Synchytrium endobioticum]|uniref:Uncharacterized protein n=1 Tax=Synchytrium endobioticum TaxID=286115 RepID=A0A507C5G5_9FUNG|nr:hypothetical protein SeLEV6574_g08001 [Synchytrium endobioticum]
MHSSVITILALVSASLVSAPDPSPVPEPSRNRGHVQPIASPAGRLRTEPSLSSWNLDQLEGIPMPEQENMDARSHVNVQPSVSQDTSGTGLTGGQNPSGISHLRSGSFSFSVPENWQPPDTLRFPSTGQRAQIMQESENGDARSHVNVQPSVSQDTSGTGPIRGQRPSGTTHLRSGSFSFSVPENWQPPDTLRFPSTGQRAQIMQESENGDARSHVNVQPPVSQDTSGTGPIRGQRPSGTTHLRSGSFAINGHVEIACSETPRGSIPSTQRDQQSGAGGSGVQSALDGASRPRPEHGSNTCNGYK